MKEKSPLELIGFVWNWTLEYLDFELQPENSFLVINILNISEYWNNSFCDWWPQSLVLERIEILKQYGEHSLSVWGTKKGTLQTADLLWLNKDATYWRDILIKAFVKDRMYNLRKDWRGDVFRLLEEVNRVLNYHEK